MCVCVCACVVGLHHFYQVSWLSLYGHTGVLLPIGTVPNNVAGTQSAVTIVGQFPFTCGVQTAGCTRWWAVTCTAGPEPSHTHTHNTHTHTHTQHTHTHTQAPIHTQHTGQHGNDGLVELIPWSWPGGSHVATTPLQGGPRAAGQVLAQSAYRTSRGATQGRIPGLHHGPHQGFRRDGGRQHACGQAKTCDTPNDSGKEMHSQSSRSSESSVETVQQRARHDLCSMGRVDIGGRACARWHGQQSCLWHSTRRMTTARLPTTDPWPYHRPPTPSNPPEACYRP